MRCDHGREEASMSVAERLREQGITMPAPGRPVANYVGAVRTGNLVFVSGHGPRHPEANITGKLGRDLTVEQGYEAARRCMIACLASLRAEIGDRGRHARSAVGMQALPGQIAVEIEMVVEVA